MSHENAEMLVYHYVYMREGNGTGMVIWLVCITQTLHTITIIAVYMYTYNRANMITSGFIQLRS